MGRRQRAGKGGKDYHGHGRTSYPCCGNKREPEGPTLQEKKADDRCLFCGKVDIECLCDPGDGVLPSEARERCLAPRETEEKP